MSSEFWERPEVVARFAERAPDHRLVPLLEEYTAPATIRVLDLGCAAGRNTLLLARLGFDVHAVDASAAMVAETRRRLEPTLGEEQATRRVQAGRMDDLSRFADGSFDLVVALGILHNARTWAEWQRSATELARVLVSGGRALIAHFSPEIDLTGEGVHPVPDEPHVYRGLPDGPGTLLRPDELDAELARLGFHAETPTSIGVTVTDTGRRVSVNGLYRKE